MSRSDRTPLGLDLARTAKQVGRSFDAALTAAGGSRPTWLILLALKSERMANQRELAAAVGIQGATLTHHLHAMERAGLLTRRRDPDNRRMHLVELTAAGQARFDQLRGAAVAHNDRVTAGLDDREQAFLAELLARLRANVADQTGPEGAVLPADDTDLP